MRILFTIFLYSPLFLNAQKIIEDKVDDFTHHHVRSTSWEPLLLNFGGSYIIHTKMSKVDAQYFLDFRIMGNSGVTAMGQGANLMFKCSGDSIITFKNLKDQVSCAGCGAVGASGSGLQGLDLTFPMETGQADYLLTHPVNKVRIYLSDGYMEFDIKDKRAAVFMKEVALVK